MGRVPRANLESVLMQSVKMYHVETCSTLPCDQISIRAANDVEFVMLTAKSGDKFVPIDLSPDAAELFAAKLIEAARLARGNLKHSQLAE